MVMLPEGVDVAADPRYRVGTASAPSVSQALSNRLDLAGPVAPGWVLRQVLSLRVEREIGGWYVVSDDIFAVYGDGGSVNAALGDYILSLIEYYHLVAHDAGRDALSAAHFAHLQSYVQPAPIPRAHLYAVQAA